MLSVGRNEAAFKRSAHGSGSCSALLQRRQLKLGACGDASLAASSYSRARSLGGRLRNPGAEWALSG